MVLGPSSRGNTNSGQLLPSTKSQAQRSDVLCLESQVHKHMENMGVLSVKTYSELWGRSCLKSYQTEPNGRATLMQCVPLAESNTCLSAPSGCWWSVHTCTAVRMQRVRISSSAEWHSSPPQRGHDDHCTWRPVSMTHPLNLNPDL
jgi:hypothetical protein